MHFTHAFINLNNLPMKKVIVLLFIICVATNGIAQNVGIGTAYPHTTAQLEISANGKGILIPRMASSERIGIAAPALGLMVYQTNGEEGFYYFDGFIWQMIGKGGNSWVKSGTNIYDENDKVGIGTTTPNTKLQVANGAEATLATGSGFVVIGSNTTTNLVVDDNEIQARNNNAISPLYLQPQNGNIAIGTLLTAPASKLQIAGGVEVGSNLHGSLLIGETVSTNLAFDTDEIQARSNATTASPLYLQTLGGNTVFGTGNIIANGKIGIGQPTPSVKLHIEGGTDAGLTAGSGYAQFGPTTGSNLLFDNNEIIARSNGATAPLYLQQSGGKTVIGEDLEVTGISNVDGALKLKQSIVNLTVFSTSFNLTVGNKSFIKINSSAGCNFVTCPQAILSDGVAIGQILIILASADGITFPDSPLNNMNLHMVRVIDNGGTLTLVWDGTIWNEVAVSDNN